MLDKWFDSGHNNNNRQTALYRMETVQTCAKTLQTSEDENVNFHMESRRET